MDLISEFFWDFYAVWKGRLSRNVSNSILQAA